MKVIWTEYHNCPEMYWGEDWCGFTNYTGEVIGITKSFWGKTFFIIVDSNNKIHEVEISKCKIIKDETNQIPGSK